MRQRDTDPGRMSDRIADLEDAPLASGRLKTVTLASGDNRIRHGLSRARGRLTVKVSAAVSLYDKDDADPSYWIVNSSGAATATFYFF